MYQARLRADGYSDTVIAQAVAYDAPSSSSSFSDSSSSSDSGGCGGGE